MNETVKNINGPLAKTLRITLEGSGVEMWGLGVRPSVADGLHEGVKGGGGGCVESVLEA